MKNKNLSSGQMAFKYHLDRSNEKYALPMCLYHFTCPGVSHTTAHSEKHARGHGVGRGWTTQTLLVQHREKYWVPGPGDEASWKEQLKQTFLSVALVGPPLLSFSAWHRRKCPQEF